jgi:hypothetical protein
MLKPWYTITCLTPYLLDWIFGSRVKEANIAADNTQSSKYGKHSLGQDRQSVLHDDMLRKM